MTTSWTELFERADRHETPSAPDEGGHEGTLERIREELVRLRVDRGAESGGADDV